MKVERINKHPIKIVIEAENINDQNFMETFYESLKQDKELLKAINDGIDNLIKWEKIRNNTLNNNVSKENERR